MRTRKLFITCKGKDLVKELAIQRLLQTRLNDTGQINKLLAQIKG